MKYDLINDDLINICKTATVQELEELSEDLANQILEYLHSYNEFQG